MQLIEGDLFADFPTLRLVIPHGGGAVPYHWGRFRGLAIAMNKPPLEEHVLDNVFFDTCVYHQPGIDLLLKVIPIRNILFASEMVGAVRDIDPCTGHHFDDTRRYLDDADLDDDDRQAVQQDNALAVYPRLSSIDREGTDMTEKTVGWLDWYQNPSTPHFTLPPGTVDAHCHVFGPAARFPFAAGTQIHARVTRARTQLFAPARPFGHQPERGRAGHLPRRRQQRDARRRPIRRRPGARHRHRPSRTSPMPSCAELDDAGVRGVRFNFLKRLVDTSPEEDLAAIARQGRPAWLARRHLFRGRRSAPTSKASSPPCPPRWSSTTWAAPTSPSRSTGRSSVASCASSTRNDVWVKVSCPERLSVTGPAALNGERHAYTDVVPFGRRVIEEFPDAVLWGTDWPHPNLTDHMPDDGLLVDHIPQIARHRRTPAQAAGDQSDAPVLAGRSGVNVPGAATRFRE